MDKRSQASFIKQSFNKKLNLSVYSIKLPISGIVGDIAYSCRKVASFHIKPHFVSDFVMEVDPHVLPIISGYSPSSSVKFNELNHLRNLVLADPNFNGHGNIEVLLGTAIHAAIINNVCRVGPLDPIAMKTKLGWIVSGNYGGEPVRGIVDQPKFNEHNLNFDLENF